VADGKARLADRAPILEVLGPLTVKETEDLVFHAARSHPQFEVSQRTWLEDDRSYFVRWRDAAPSSPLQVIGLVHIFQLPEMACRLTVVPFADEPPSALAEYRDLLADELAREGFFA